jgi:hypothetical protein
MGQVRKLLPEGIFALSGHWVAIPQHYKEIS